MGKFYNKNGKELKSILPMEIILKIAELVDDDLNEQNIPYIREGTAIQVFPQHLELLYEAQLHANEKLLADGVLTMKMLKDDARANGII
jgi:hypothetical protein